MRRLLIGLLLAGSALAQPAATVASGGGGGGGTDPFPRVAAAYLVQVNGHSAPLWAKQATRRLPPASLTKLMTALLVLEAGQPQAVVRISATAARETGTRLALRVGERFRVVDLLAATLLGSANDACHALAEHVAGSQTRFVDRMNHRAAEFGMRDTHFANACGHDAADHYSTAQDLAVLANAALKQPVLSELAARAHMDISTLDGRRHFKIENHNALVGRYPGVVGLKSGYTPEAGKCLIALAQRGKTRILLILLNAPKRWWDATDILDLAFAHEDG